MADNTILLDIKVSNQEAVLAIKDAQRALAELKNEEKSLDGAVKDGTITQEKYAQEITRVKTEMEEQTNVLRANQDALKQNVREQQTAEKSLVAMRAQLKKLITAYDNLSEAERTGAKGTELLSHITELTKSIKHAEEESGRFQRNVGNYKNSFVDAVNSLGGLKDGLEGVGAKGAAKAVDGIKKVNTGLNALKANPIGAIITAVTFAVTQLTKAFSSDEKAMASLKNLTKAFQPILNVFKAIFEKIVQVVTKAINAIAKFFGKLTSAVPFLKKFNTEQAVTTEKTEEVAEATEQATKATNSYADAVKKAAEVERAERQKVLDMTVKMMGAQRDIINAEADKQIGDLRRRLETEKTLTEGAKKSLNAQIVLLDAQREIELSKLNEQEMLNSQAVRAEIIKAQLASTKNNLDEEFRLRHEALVAQNTDAKMMLDSRLMDEKLTQEQYETLLNEMRTKFTADEVALEEEKNARLLDVVRQRMQNEINALAEGSIERMNAEIELRRTELEAVHQMEYESEEQFIARKTALQQNYDKAVQASADKQVAINKAKAQGIADITGSLSATLEAAAGENEDLVMASKAVALAEVAIKQGVAIAEAIASAAAGDPYTYALRVASAVASTIAAMASAISSINSASFATGGLVQGPGTATSDSIRANLSNGEFVVNAKGTREHLAELVAFNGGWGNTSHIPRYAQGGVVGLGALSASQSMADTQSMILDAVEGIQPVVSVREIMKVQQKVSAKERISRQ